MSTKIDVYARPDLLTEKIVVLSTMPTRIPAKNAIGMLSMRASTATARPAMSTPGPT